MISLLLIHMQIRLYLAACYESADQYIISADIFLGKRGRFVVKSADFFITQKSVNFT